MTTGYFGGGAAAAEAFEDGWFHTGDIGEVDAEGRLFIKGRKKEMIVTPEGLNVFPEDVERVLVPSPGVRDVAVVGVATGAKSASTPSSSSTPGADPQAVVRERQPRARRSSEDSRHFALAAGELPRTEGTRKLKRREIRDWVATGAASGNAASADGESSRTWSRGSPAGARSSRATTLDELGLSSLERVELMVAIEEKFGTTIDEAAFSSAPNVAALETDRPAGARATDEPAERVDFPTWNRAWPPASLRRVSLPTWMLPLARVFAWIRSRASNTSSDLEGPVIFASNHQSHMDTPAILWALPSRWRYRVAIAMAKEFFKAHFFPDQFGRRRG